MITLLMAVQALGSTSCCGLKWGWKLVLEVIQWCYEVRPYLLIFFFEFFENSLYYILTISPLPQLLPEPSACFHSHWTWCPYFLFVCFLPLSPIYVAHTLFHVWASIGTRVVNLPGATSLKKMDSTFPSNHQLLIASQLGVGLHAMPSLHAGILSGLCLHGSCACSTSAVSLYCILPVVSREDCFVGDTYHLWFLWSFHPLFYRDPEPWEGKEWYRFSV